MLHKIPLCTCTYALFKKFLIWGPLVSIFHSVNMSCVHLLLFLQEKSYKVKGCVLARLPILNCVSVIEATSGTLSENAQATKQADLQGYSSTLETC